MTLSTNRTGVIRSTSRAISSIADTINDAATTVNHTLAISNGYLADMLAEQPEELRMSRAINRAENISELMTTLSITEKQAIAILDGK